MRERVSYAILVSLCGIVLWGCVPSYKQLRFTNSSDKEIVLIVSFDYPDSSFEEAFVGSGVAPKATFFVLTSFDLRKMPGLTLFVFDNAYWRGEFPDAPSSPHKYLDVERMLGKYHLSKEQLDSLGWKLSYP